jgi:hypothetical protein
MKKAKRVNIPAHRILFFMIKISLKILFSTISSYPPDEGKATIKMIPEGVGTPWSISS